MKDATRLRSSSYQSISESGNDQVIFHPSIHAPANDPARKHIQHHGQVQPAFAGSDRGDVTGPQMIVGGCGELAIDQIEDHRPLMIRIGRHLEPAGGLHVQATLLH